MKIGILTLNGKSNYGNRLQNYALQEYIKRLNNNIEVETILNNNNYANKEKFIEKIKLNRIIGKIKNDKNRFLYKTNISNRQKKFDVFNNKIKETSYIINSKNLYEEKINKFDYFIIGSDQVWSPSFSRVSKIDFAMFAPKDKVISYAASFGVSSIPKEYNDLYFNGINNVKNISVREESGKKIVNQITKRQDAEVLVDPTMLLEKKDWNLIINKPEKLTSKKYILNYFLGKLSKEKKSEVVRIAKENNCDIININDIKDKLYGTGPSEFVYLEKNAFLVCTDSFHSCVFATLYNVPFIVFDRDDYNVSMNSRIDTLISKFKIENRKYNGKIDNSQLKCDYSKANKMLEIEREKSKIFLEKALDIKEN